MNDMITAVNIIKPGFLTTIQDIPGRRGLKRFGIPSSGTMDTHSAELANWLVGNDLESPLFEITFGKCEFEFTERTVVGLSGGKAKVLVSDESVQLNKTLIVGPGERLKVGRVSKGARIYLAIGGRWQIKQSLGSFSTYANVGLGGVNGRELMSGDRIEVDSSQVQESIKTVPDELIPHFSRQQNIRVITGPEWDWLRTEQKNVFLQTRFGISSTSNRMGIRLKKENNVEVPQRNFSSAPVVPGIIQLPSGGEPIILMNDAQSVGGYPRILKVAEADLWRLGQVWQGNEISFSLIERRDALKLLDYYKNLRESHLM